MRQNDSWADAKALRQFFDHLSDAVLLFDRNARVTFANTAALSVLPCEIGMPLGQLRGLLGDIALRWVQQRVSASVDIDPPTLATTLHDGRPARLVWQVLDATLSALSLQLIVPARAADTAAAPLSTELSEPGVAELVRVFWKSPFPATLQDSAYRIVDVNAAYLEFSGYPRETLIGIDPLQLQPEEDRDTNRAARDEFAAALSRADVPPLIERRIIDARGRERWFRAARSALIDDAGQHLYLVVLQDTTAEHAARDSADRSVRELDSWFDLSPLGMVLFDEAGLVVRTNPAFEALVGEVPAVLAEASLGLQQLLVWHDGAPAPELRATRRAVVVQGWLPQPDGSQRRLRSNVRCYTTPSGQQRYMAVVEDRSIEEERDLAQMQIGALIDTAGVGIATFQESSGWVRQRHAPAGEAASSASASSAALQSISRDIVVPDSLPEYERLQHALRHAQRAEVRYAVRHPELGLRWLFTRVEPATLASGQRTTSVVTLDVTEQKTQALELEILARDRELMFSLSEVGIAFVRDGRLQRANDALAQLSGYSAAEISGLPIEQLFPDSQDDPRRAARERNTLRQFGRWVGERQLKRRDGQLLWMQVGERLVTEGDPAGGIIASYVNVDDRHRAEQAVALQADRTRAILDSVLVGIVTVGPGGIEWMNRSARRMFGGDLAEFVGQPISTVATTEPLHPFRQTQHLDALAEGQADTFECRVKARDGREFWVVGNTVMTGRESTGRQLTYALLDIERRRQAEARTAEAQASLQRIIEAAPMAITLFDARSLKVVQVNEVAAQGAGRAGADIIGRTPEELFEPALAAQARRDMTQALSRSSATQFEYRVETNGASRVWDARYMPLAAPGQPPDQLLLVSTDVTEQRAAQEARFEAALAQREMLVKEVHHRIKNNLQGVAGLLQQIAARKPEVAAAMSEVVAQVQAIAQVYGLQVGVTGPLRVKSVVEAITGSVQRTFGQPITLAVEGVAPHLWALPEAESIPIALTVNELLTNAVKHRSPGAGEAVACTLVCADSGVRVVISNRGELPAGFTLARFPGGVSGLGLVRSLLPRRSASLSIEQHDTNVVATVALAPPGVTRL